MPAYASMEQPWSPNANRISSGGGVASLSHAEAQDIDHRSKTWICQVSLSMDEPSSCPPKIWWNWCLKVFKHLESFESLTFKTTHFSVLFSGHIVVWSRWSGGGCWLYNFRTWHTISAATTSQQNWRRGCMMLYVPARLINAWSKFAAACRICDDVCRTSTETLRVSWLLHLFSGMWLEPRRSANRSMCAWTYFVQTFQSLKGLKAAQFEQKLLQQAKFILMIQQDPEDQ